MKNLLLLFAFIITSNFLSAQTFKFPLSSDSTIEYTNVVQLKDTTTLKKEYLYSLIRTWFGNKFVNSKYVLQVDDQYSGRLLAKANGSADYCFSIEVFIKNAKYKYRVYNIQWLPTFERQYMNVSVSIDYFKYLAGKPLKFGFESKNHAIKSYDDIFKRIDTEINSLINSLQTEVLKQKERDNF